MAREVFANLLFHDFPNGRRKVVVANQFEDAVKVAKSHYMRLQEGLLLKLRDGDVDLATAMTGSKVEVVKLLRTIWEIDKRLLEVRTQASS